MIHVIDFCVNSLVTSELPAQRASNAENVSIRWRHHIHMTSVFVKFSISENSTIDMYVAWKNTTLAPVPENTRALMS